MPIKSLLEATLMEWLFGNWEFGRFRASCPGEFFLSASQGAVLREQSAELLMAHRQHWFNKTRDKCFVPASRRRHRAEREKSCTVSSLNACAAAQCA